MKVKYLSARGNEQQPRTGRPVLGASLSDCSEWNIDEKWSSQEWKSDEMLEARTERLVVSTKFDRDTLNQEKHDNVTDPTSTGRPARGHESTERCVLTPKHVENDQTSTVRPVTVDQKEELDINLRVPGLSHSVVKESEHLRVQELVRRIENHPLRAALQADLQQNSVYIPFSKNSKEMIRELGNVELFELCETTPNVQCSPMSSLLESKNCVQHLRTMLDLHRIQKKV